MTGEEVKTETEQAKPEKVNAKCKKIAEEMKAVLNNQFGSLSEAELVKSVKFCWLSLRDKK